MSFGFGISDFEYVFATTLRLRQLLRDLREVPDADDQMEADISLMVDLLKESVEMLGKIRNPAPASVRAAMVRFTILMDKKTKDFGDVSRDATQLDPRRLPSMAQQLPKQLEAVSTFHNIVSQFYERSQLDRLIELQISSRPRQSLPTEDNDKHSMPHSHAASKIEPTLPLTGNAGHNKFMFLGVVHFPVPESERGGWIAFKGSFDTQSARNIVHREIVQRCRLEHRIVRTETVTLETREDQKFYLDQKIRLTWAMNNDPRSYETDFLVDDKALGDVLLGTSFKELLPMINDNRSFRTIRVGVSNQEAREREAAERQAQADAEQETTRKRQAERAARREAERLQRSAPDSTSLLSTSSVRSRSTSRNRSGSPASFKGK